MGRGGRVGRRLELVEASNGRQRKLSISDTGCGMTAAELRHFINNLAASGQTIGLTANQGLGAKIAGGYHTPRGLQYRSWREGRGTQVVFRKRGRVWGLERQ